MTQTDKEFAIILTNLVFLKTFSNDLMISIQRIVDNFNSKQKYGWFKLNFIKTVSMDKRVLKLGAEYFIFYQDLADAIQEILPTHGITAIPWSKYSEK